MNNFTSILLCTLCILIGLPAYVQTSNEIEGIYLNHTDLIELSKTSKPQGELLQKLEKQLNTPIIKQPEDKPPPFLRGEILGDFFRVGSWNIERGFNVDRIEEIINHSTSSLTSDELKEELNIFSKSSIIILNEVDIGVPRTKYENIVERIAKKFKMGYVFGTEFIEVDPYQLGIKKFTKQERLFLEEQALNQLDNIEVEKFLGLHGTAILSKYPILNAKIIRLPDCYHWYREESNKLSALELLRRETAEKVFASKVLTELRHGGRMAVVVDLLLPNDETITVVATHLENRCVPECRYKQFEHLLNNLRDIRNPVIIGGDFNTTGTDVSPTTIKKEVLKRVKDPEYIARYAILSLTPVTAVQTFVFNTLNYLRQFKDPTIKNIPIVFPNKERKLFDLLSKFRFTDGSSFDLGGNKEKTYRGHSGFLSNSNERGLKGFKPTFKLERHFGVAKYKLDWFFVKPLSSSSYLPFFGRTLSELNKSFGEISDHDPITVDIPIH